MAEVIRDIYTFDGSAKEVRLKDGTKTFDVIDLYSASIDYLRTDEGRTYLPFAFSIGNNPISDDTNVGAYVFINTKHDWVLRPPNEDKIKLIVVGNMYPIEVGAEMIKPYDDKTVMIEMRNSSLSSVVRVSTGSGLSGEEHDKLMAVPNATDNADATWNKVI